MKEYRYFRDNTDEDYDPSKDHYLNEALKAANTGDKFGAILGSKDSGSLQSRVHWLKIADQIFDPYHGRLIRISDKDDLDNVA